MFFTQVVVALHYKGNVLDRLACLQLLQSQRASTHTSMYLAYYHSIVIIRNYLRLSISLISI
jgi:hypothetical protein